MKKTGGLIHAIAECRQCKWRCENYATAHEEAREHVEATAHHVLIDTGYCYEYEPEAAKENP